MSEWRSAAAPAARWYTSPRMPTVLSRGFARPPIAGPGGGVRSPRRRRAALAWLVVAALLLASSCGAGLVTGAFASGANGDSAGPPSLSLPGQDFPLVPVPTVRARTVVVANALLAPTAALQVRLLVHDGDDPAGAVLVAQDQTAPTIVSGQGNSTVLRFDLATDAITARLGVAADVRARLAVLVDGRTIGSSVPVTLLRQPSLRLFDGAPVFLSPDGQTIRLAAGGLRSADASGIQVSVTTVDPTGVAAVVTRICLRPQFAAVVAGVDPPLLPDEQLVTAEVPGNTFAGAAQFFVDDATAGRSATVDGAFYRPDVTVALPAQGSTRGGTKVTLIGRALAPLIPALVPGAPDFDQIEMLFRKGDRELRLPDTALLRAESTLDRLVFTMPSSPDGRPGNVGIVLRARLRQAAPLPDVTAEVIADDKFLFANPEPVFGPRGTVLEGDPIAVAPIAIEGAPDSRQATDFGVLYSQGNFAALQLLLAQENGMFIRAFGPAQRIGNPAVVAEREPRDLLAGDFDQDRVPDLLIVNAGLGSAVHHVVRGQPAPAPPLGEIVRFATPAGMSKGRVADFDRDGRDDVLLVPGAGAALGQVPIVLLQRSAPGLPAFTSPRQVPVRSYSYDAFEVADLDGDGFLDVAVAAGGTQMSLDVAYGDGAGNFAVTAQLDFTVPFANYVRDPGSIAVGLHALGTAPRSLAVVLAGLPAVLAGTPPVPTVHPNTPPLLVMLRPNTARSYAQPISGDVLQQVGAIDPFRSSRAVNLDGVGAGNDELLVGSSGEQALLGLGFFRRDPGTGRFSLVPILDRFNGKELNAMFFGVAFPADPGRNQPEVPAVFVKHEITVDGEVERRLSTLLVATEAQPPPSLPLVQLLPPEVGFGVPLAGIVGGSFSANGVASGGATRDLAVPSALQIRLGDNNGFGALAPGNVMLHAGLVPETTTRVPAPAGVADALVFFDDGTRDGRTDGELRVGQWRPLTDTGSPQQQVPSSFSENLRLVLPAPFAGAAIDPSSRMQPADVDGDGRLDLVVLLRFVGRRDDGDALLFVMPGLAVIGEGDFPFELPAAGALLPVHGSATAFALGDFAPEAASAPVRLELVLAVPVSTSSNADDGNHLRFYRVAGPIGTARWQRSFAAGSAEVLVAGNAPTRVAADDFDRNGTVDLLVAADGDASLRLFLNSGQPATDPREVLIEAFGESLASPLPTQPGRHTSLLLGDINGDGNVDALLATEFTLASGSLTSSVAFYLSSGTGAFGNPTLVSPARLGDRDARLSLDLGDINSDGVPDLSLGWFQAGTGGDNLRVLLGGSR